MGKKSKRHTCKKSAKKETEEECKEIQNDRGIESDQTTEIEREKELNMIEDEKDFEAFMLWTLSEDKAELTPKKFEKMAPRTAKALITGRISSQQILDWREKTILVLDEQLKEFELEKGMKLLMEEVKLKNEKEEDKFLKDLNTVIDRQKAYMVPPANVFDSFQEVANYWKESRNVCLDDCRFVKMPVSEFYEYFMEMLPKFVNSQEVSESNGGKLFQRFYSHPSSKRNYPKDELQKLLSSLLSLYQDMKECWECNGICSKEIERSLICSLCKCATYCSRECQVKHWKQGNHKDSCKYIGDEWSTYERNKKRVERALYKDQKVYTKPIKVNRIKRECHLRPCETFDFFLCFYNSGDGDTLSSIDTFYKNIAALACGGKHILFGNDTISSQLEKKFKTDVQSVILEFDTLLGYEITAMKNIASLLPYKETDLDLTEEIVVTTMRNNLSVDRFLTLYIFFKSDNLCKYITGQEEFDKFKAERGFLEFLKRNDDGSEPE